MVCSYQTGQAHMAAPRDTPLGVTCHTLLVHMSPHHFMLQEITVQEVDWLKAV